MPGYRLASSDKNSIDDKYFCSFCELLLREAMKTSRGDFYCQSCLPSLIPLSIIPTSKVKNIIEGDRKTAGSLVELYYGSLLLKAEIIAVDDDHSRLTTLSLDYENDPKNAHRFKTTDSPDHDEQSVSSAADSNEQEEEENASAKQQQKKQKKKKKISESEQPVPANNKRTKKADVGKHQEPKAKKQKEKEQATVVIRVAPAPSSEAPSEDQAIDHPQLLQVPPPSPGYSTSPHSMPPSTHTPRRSPSAAAIPKRLNYANTTIYSDWSSSSPIPFTPGSASSSRATPSPLFRGTAWRTPLRQSLASEVDWRSPLRPSYSTPEMDWPSPLPSSLSPEMDWQSPSRPQLERQWCSPLRERQMSPQSEESIFQMLRRIERKVDNLTELLETSKPSPVPQDYGCTVRDRHDQFLPSSIDDNHTFNPEEEEFTSDDPLRPLSLVTIKAQSSSSMNFAVRLLRAFFTRPELRGKNVSGVRGKEQLDTERIAKIRNIVFEFYPTAPSERESVWRECRKAIDSYLRKAFPRSS